jgi:CheY-like chemotaxis protein
MRRQITHLTSLVDQLLDVSRISSGAIHLDRRPVELNELVRTLAGDYEGFVQSRGLKLEARLPERPLWVEGDPVRLAQALGNLVHNAGKFTDCGSVVVELGSASNNRAMLAVRDTGIGMEPEMLARLFVPFSQADRGLGRSRGGLGLGLALAKQLIEMHGGTIEAHSDGTSRGAEFVAHLPLTAQGTPKPARTDRRVVEEPEPEETRNVLIVEDNADAADSLRAVLELDGHRVAVASDGPSALTMARGRKPDIVLCDVGLAGAMDGYGVAAAFRADPTLRGTHLIALTGYGQDRDRERALEAGFDLHIRKPADPEALKRWLTTLPVRE